MFYFLLYDANIVMRGMIKVNKNMHRLLPFTSLYLHINCSFLDFSFTFHIVNPFYKPRSRSLSLLPFINSQEQKYHHHRGRCRKCGKYACYEINLHKSNIAIRYKKYFNVQYWFMMSMDGARSILGLKAIANIKHEEVF